MEKNAMFSSAKYITFLAGIWYYHSDIDWLKCDSVKSDRIKNWNGGISIF